MTDHREAGQHWLENAIDWYGQVPDTDAWEKTTASAFISGAFFLAAGGDEFDAEEQHQSEKFESTPLEPVELDEDNPDTLAEYAVDDADTVVRPAPFGRQDFYGYPLPWGAA